MTRPPQYSVHGPDGQTLMHTDSDFRYPPQTELSMLSAGLTIRRDGKRLTKKEILANAEHCKPYGPSDP